MYIVNIKHVEDVSLRNSFRSEKVFITILRIFFQTKEVKKAHGCSLQIMKYLSSINYKGRREIKNNRERKKFVSFKEKTRGKVEFDSPNHLDKGSNRVKNKNKGG